MEAPPTLASTRGTSDPTTATATALAATLGLAATCWVVAIRQMSGTDMGVASELGSFASFLVLWESMMAAMMLPGAVCLLYTSPSPRDLSTSRMPSSA